MQDIFTFKVSLHKKRIVAIWDILTLAPVTVESPLPNITNSHLSERKDGRNEHYFVIKR